MILPGTLPLSIIRGIEFEGAILRLSDQDATVTGTLNPNVAGTFALSGQFGGYDFYVLTGAPSTFLYYNAAATSYVIARLLTTAALTDYWSPTAPIIDDPTGTYNPHGANTGTATVTDHPVDLTGLTPEAEVKRTSGSSVALDLNPSVTNASIGEITIPPMTTTETQDLDFVGTFNWDLVLRDGGGGRTGPYVKGPFLVSDNITQPANA